ncbi:hypothetical protein [Ralstonia syzygii]|uniref:EF-hand domain-containing protein n=1 Tax=Ralstonia syzygii R24 TaxID=907261 RepID=G2ZY92_9RALS|nr:hypothetical protein [Ralstonia syzygii]CCA85286.1 conserved hypothetical protein [Ralstonia syzygii R24]
MAEQTEPSKAASEAVPVVGAVRNQGEPLRFANVENIAGFAAESVSGGQTIKVWTKLALTSDEPLFHRLVESLEGTINYMAQQSGRTLSIRRAETVLLVLRPDNTAELWIDTAAVSIRCAVKRSIAAGAPVFEHDIADVTGMAFPCVPFGESDKVLCLFREGWRFGFAFDMNPDGKLGVDDFVTTLGTLFGELRYRHVYEAISDTALFDQLVAAGWFPFIEIITTEFKNLQNHCEAGFDIADIEADIVARFDSLRLQRMLARWLAKPHFEAKAALLKEAIEAFEQKKPASVIKIVLTEIEGVLNDAYRAKNGGQGAKLNSAELRAGASNTLFFSAAFGRYLSAHCRLPLNSIHA